MKLFIVFAAIVVTVQSNGYGGNHYGNYDDHLNGYGGYEEYSSYEPSSYEHGEYILPAHHGHGGYHGGYDSHESYGGHGYGVAYGHGHVETAHPVIVRHKIIQPVIIKKTIVPAVSTYVSHAPAYHTNSGYGNGGPYPYIGNGGYGKGSNYKKK